MVNIIVDSEINQVIFKVRGDITPTDAEKILSYKPKESGPKSLCFVMDSTSGNLGKCIEIYDRIEYFNSIGFRTIGIVSNEIGSGALVVFLGCTKRITDSTEWNDSVKFKIHGGYFYRNIRKYNNDLRESLYWTLEDYRKNNPAMPNLIQKIDEALKNTEANPLNLQIRLEEILAKKTSIPLKILEETMVNLTPLELDEKTAEEFSIINV